MDKLSVIIRGFNERVPEVIDGIKRKFKGDLNINIICSENEKIGIELGSVIHHYSGEYKELEKYEDAIALYDDILTLNSSYVISDEKIGELIDKVLKGIKIDAKVTVESGNGRLILKSNVYRNSKKDYSGEACLNVERDYNKEDVEEYISNSMLFDNQENLIDLIRIEQNSDMIFNIEEISRKIDKKVKAIVAQEIGGSDYSELVEDGIAQFMMSGKYEKFMIPQFYNLLKTDKKVLGQVLEKVIIHNKVDFILNETSKKYDDIKNELYDFIINYDENDDNLKKIKLALAKYYVKNYFKKNSAGDKRRLTEVFEKYVDLSIIFINQNRYDRIKAGDKKFIIHMDEAIGYIMTKKFQKAILLLKKMQQKYVQYKYVLQVYIQQIIIQNKLFKKKMSICLIVKNEEENIGRCLNSVMPLVDKGLADLVVVDTGSEDKTVDIVKSFPCRVEYFQWTGHFADARNYCHIFAENEFIFNMDADEEFNPEHIQDFCNDVQDDEFSKFGTYTLGVINFKTSKKSEFSNMVRPLIFRNTTDFHFSGSVHNQPNLEMPMKDLDYDILHYGYIMEGEIKERKFKRTATLLKKELSKAPTDIYYRFQLSTSYSMYGDQYNAEKQADIYVNQIKQDWESFKKKPNMLYLSSYASTKNVCGEFEASFDICNIGLELNPEFIDLWHNKAIAQLGLKDYEGALVSLENYFDIYDRKDEIPCLNDIRVLIYSFNEYTRNLGHIFYLYHELGKHSDAIKLYDKLLPEKRNNPIIVNSYIYSCLKENRIEDAIDSYSKIEQDKDKERFVYSLKKIMLNEFNMTIDEIKRCNKDEFLSVFEGVKIDEGVYLISDGCDFSSLEVDVYYCMREALLTFVSSNSITVDTETKLVEQYCAITEYILYCMKIEKSIGKTEEDLIGVFRDYMDAMKILGLLGEESLSTKKQKIIDSFRKFDDAEFKMDLLGSMRELKNICTLNERLALIVQLYIEKIYGKKITESELHRQSEINGIKNSIMKMINLEMFEESAEMILKLEDEELVDQEVIYLKGLWFARQSDYESAFEVFGIGLQQFPKSFYFNYEISNIYYMIGERELGDKYLKIALCACSNKEMREKCKRSLEG